MKKVTATVVICVGIAILLASFVEVRDMLGLALPSIISETTLLIIGAVVVAIGLFLSIQKQRSHQPAEVPIYHGKDIVGFRRVHHK